MRGDWQLLLTMAMELRRYYILNLWSNTLSILVVVITFVVKPLLHLWLVITFVVKPYYICGRLLHLWSTLITFVVVITFVVNYYICGFYKHAKTTTEMTPARKQPSKWRQHLHTHVNTSKTTNRQSIFLMWPRTSYGWMITIFKLNLKGRNE